MHSFFAIIPGMAGWSEIVLVLALALILFGPKRLPEIAEAAGKSIRKFKSATRNATDEVKREIDEVGRSAFVQLEGAGLVEYVPNGPFASHYTDRHALLTVFLVQKVVARSQSFSHQKSSFELQFAELIGHEGAGCETKESDLRAVQLANIRHADRIARDGVNDAKIASPIFGEAPHLLTPVRGRCSQPANSLQRT